MYGNFLHFYHAKVLWKFQVLPAAKCSWWNWRKAIYIEVARIGGEHNFERFTYLLLQSFQTVKGLKALQYKWCFLKTHKQRNIILLPYKQLRYSLRWQLWPATEDYKDFITSFSHPHQLHWTQTCTPQEHHAQPEMIYAYLIPIKYKSFAKPASDRVLRDCLHGTVVSRRAGAACLLISHWKQVRT